MNETQRVAFADLLHDVKILHKCKKLGLKKPLDMSKEAVYQRTYNHAHKEQVRQAGILYRQRARERYEGYASDPQRSGGCR